MALDPDGMLVFSALAREGGVRAAAKALGVPRSTVSRKLGQLEAQAGAPLVVRTARRFTLTELGAALAERADRLGDLLQESEDLVRRSSSEPSGTLRIAASPDLGGEVLPEIVSALLAAHPRLSVELKLSVDYADLRRGGIDVALRAWPLDDASDLFAFRLATSVTGVYVAPSYARERGVPKVPSDLAKHDCILVGSGTPKTWSFRTHKPVAVTGRVRVDNVRLARALAVHGAGVVRTARIFGDVHVAKGELVPVLENQWPDTPIHAVHAGANPPSPKVRAFVEIARKMVGHVFQSELR